MSVIIAMSNTGAKLVGADQRTIAIVSDLLSYDVEGAQFTAGFKLGDWNGKKTFLLFPDLLFQAGFVPMVRQALAENGIPVSIHDVRRPVTIKAEEIDLIDFEPYDFQLEAVAELERHKRGVIQAATGAGKTEIAIMATKRFGVSTLFLTHKLDLVRQTRKRYMKRLGRPVGMISEGEWLPADITVATVQTIMSNWTRIWKIAGERPAEDKKKTKELYDRACAEARKAGMKKPKRKDFFVQLRDGQGNPVWLPMTAEARGMTEVQARRYAKTIHGIQKVHAIEMIEDRAEKVGRFLAGVEFLIVDEAHRASGDSFFKTINACTGAYLRCGLTATPLMKGNREEDLKLIACTGNVIFRITNGELIRRGILAQPYFIPVEVPKFTINGRSAWTTAYPTAYAKGIVHNAVRNGLVVDWTRRLVAENRKTVVLVQEIEHGTILERLLLAAGVRCRWISGRDRAEAREQALNDLRDGTIEVLIASTILDEGLDCDAISGLVLAGGGKSKIALFQRVGRSVRKKKGDDLRQFGNTAKVVDFIDTGNKYLMEHSAKRYKAVKDEDGWILEPIVPYQPELPLAVA